ncbi:MAG: hypothetical protein HYU66_05580 [Armatimonadetes bacterium]|nr:hypothetical protein [Armatimonadota bacterium]
MKNLALGLLLSLTVSVALAAGPTVGEKAPPLNVDAVNDGQRGKYDAIEDAAGKVTVVFFLDMFSAQNEDHQAVGRFLFETYKANREKGLHAIAVIPGSDGYRDDLQAFCEAQQIDFPVAPMAYDDQDFAGWKMEAKLQSLLVVVVEGKVAQVLENATLDQVQAALPEFLAKLGGSLAEGDPAPALHVDAANDGDRGKYDVLDDAGGKLLIVHWLNLASVQDEAQQAVLQVLMQSFAENKAKGLKALTVVPGADGLRDQIQAYCAANNLTLPIAPIAVADPDLAGWKLDPKLKNLVVAICDGKIVKLLPDIKVDDLKTALPELLKKLVPAD